MAQLKEDEWPEDREQTTQEGPAFKREGSSPAKKETSRSAEEMDRAADDDWVINNVDPDEATD